MVQSLSRMSIWEIPSTFLTDIYYIEFVLAIEHLPSELRDRFTDMREMDLRVQSKYVYAHLILIRDASCLLVMLYDQ